MAFALSHACRAFALSHACMAFALSHALSLNQLCAIG